MTRKDRRRDEENAWERAQEGEKEYGSEKG